MSGAPEEGAPTLDGLQPFKSPALPKRDPRACASCQFSAKEGKDRVCRFEPPKLFFFPMQTMAMGPSQRPVPAMEPKFFTCFPIVMDHQWCGKFSMRDQG